MSKHEVGASEWTAVSASIDACRQQLRQCERSMIHHADDDGNYHEGEQYESDKSYLGSLIRQANLRMLLLIERVGLPLFRSNYIEAMAPFDGEFDRVGHSPYDPEDLFSEPLMQIDQVFDALSAVVHGSKDKELSGLALFERILRQTPYIVHDRTAHTPMSETEIRKPLFDLLKTVFPDCRREIPVSHIFKVYKADLGVTSLKALAEIKYAVDEKELRAQIGGIYEDVKGYSGDPQWTQFFAVFYTTDPIASPERIEEEFKLSRIGWVPIVVHGTGTRLSRKPSPPRASAASTPRKPRAQNKRWP